MSTVTRSVARNINVIYLMGFFHSFMVLIPVLVPLLQGYGLSMTQVLQTQALFALTIAVCEVPSGYIADLWGRRGAIIVGSLINAVGCLLLLWADTFIEFLVYEFLLGVGVSLISGADLALLYDSELYLSEHGLDGGAGASKSLSRLISIEAGASGIAGIVASVLLIWSLDAVVWLQAFTGLAPLLLGFVLLELPRPASSGHRDNARRIVDLLLFSRPVVLCIAVALVVFGLFSLYVFWVYQKYWEIQQIPLENFGYIWAAYALTVSAAAHGASWLEHKLGVQRFLVLIIALPVAGLLGMTLGNGWWGVLFGLAVQVGRGLSVTVFYEALNRRVPGDFRATVNSLVSLGVRGVFIITGPVLGYALDNAGITNTLLGLLLVFAPLMVLTVSVLLTQLRRESAAAEPVAIINEQPVIVGGSG